MSENTTIDCNTPHDKNINVVSSFNNNHEKQNAVSSLNKLLSHYPRVFDTSIKKNIKVTKVRLRFKKNVTVTPYKCNSSKPIPFALRDAAKREIEEQINLGIIARVPPEVDIDWCSRGMILEKSNGGRDVRLVVDSREINEFLDRDAFPMQSPKELIRQIPPSSKFFLTVDFYKGYYQIPIAEEDQMKTTFMLHSMGIYHFKRLPQGGKCSVDQFNRITDELVREIPKCLKMVDDVLFHGETIEEVLKNFSRLLVKCHQRDFTLHPKKIAFGNKLKFAGYVVSDKGIGIDPRKVEAIRKFKPPQNVTDMKAFIGVAVQFQDACPNLMGTLKPLIETTSNKITPAIDEKGKKIKNPKRVIFWNKNLEDCFFKVKKLLTDADGTVLTPYNPKLPLIGIMKKPLEKMETKRLMKFAEKLQDYEFSLEYVQGVNNEVAVALSRNPVREPGPDDPRVANALMVNLVNDYEGGDVCSMTDIKLMANMDQEYQEIKRALMENIAAKNIPPEHPARMYKSDWNLLAIQEGLITLGERILVPKGARKDILRNLHISHMGRNKTIALAKSLYYWKHMARDIEHLVESCDKCQVHSSFQQKETLKQTFAEGPMDMNSADLVSYAGKNYLVHADRFLNFLWVYQLRTTDVKT